MNTYKPTQVFPLDEAAIKELFPGVPYPSNYWSILDRHENLILLHYNPETVGEMLKDKDLSEEVKNYILSFRGLVINVALKEIACKSFGYSPDVHVDDSLPEKLIDVNGNDQSDFLQALAYRFYEGVGIRVWHYHGQTYFSTNKKIDCSKSSFGKSPKFLDIYRNLNGPTENELFSSNQFSSNIVYFFLLSVKELLVTSKIDVGNGSLVYLGYTHIEEHFNNNEVPFWNQMSTPLPLTKDQINSTLYNGFLMTNTQPSCDFLKFGEPVVFIKTNSVGAIVSTCKVIPKSYIAKTKILNQNPNLFHRACELNEITLKGDSEFFELFPLQIAPTPKQFQGLKDFVDSFELFTTDNDIVRNLYVASANEIKDSPDVRFRIALFALLMSAPSYHQIEICDFYDRFQQKKKLLFNFLNNNLSVLTDIFVNKKPNTFLTQIQWTKNNTTTPAYRGVERLITTSVKGYPFQKKLTQEMIKDNLKLLVERESGSRTYQITQAIEKSQQQ